MEWIRLRSLRSTRWALLFFVASMIGLGVLTMAKTGAPSAADAQHFDPTNNLLVGVALGQLILGAMGVLVAAGEYSSGTIRSTLAAIPNRRLLLAAKAAVLGGVILSVGEIVAVITFFVGRAALTDAAPAPTLSDPSVLRAVLMSGVYLALVGLIGLGLGAITRHTASAIGALVGVTFVLPLIAAGLAGVEVSRFFPTVIAGNSMLVVKPFHEALSPWTGLAMMCLYTAVTLGAGSWLLARRDA
jgi:ABC-type transport system involved in multi-copper enzyme maturation permease subunit